MKAIFLDLETTGLDPAQHCPIDVAFQVLDLGTGEIKGKYQSLVKQPLQQWERRDPSSMQVHGYAWEQLQSGKETHVISQEIIALFNRLNIIRGNTVFVCQNPAFDRPFFTQIVPVYTQEKLNWPYHWLDLASMYWTQFAQGLHHEQKPYPETLNLSKNSIAAQYGIPPEERPHHAMNGVEHLIACYRAVQKVTW